MTNPLVVEPLQYRDDVVANQMQLQVTNGLAEALPVTGVQFLWSGFSTPVIARQLTINPGQRVDLPVPLPAPTCTINGTNVAPAPALTEASVHFTLADGTDRTAAVIGDEGILTGIYETGCEQQMVQQHASITFADVRVATIADRPLSVGVLRVTRVSGTETITVLSAGDTIPFTLLFPAAATNGPLAQLATDSTEVEIGVYFAEGRCDAHAVAEAKQPFRFVLQVDLGDGVTRPLVVEPDQLLHTQMLATVAQGCAALELDGTLQPGA